MRFIFPEIKTTRTGYESVEKIEDEVIEFRTSTKKTEDEEAVDILHATETFIRKQFEGREDILDDLIKKVIEKNNNRGYYTKPCF